MPVEAGAKVRLEVLRAKEKLAFDVPVADPPHEMDQIASLADPEKNLVRPLGIIGIEIDQKIAAMTSDLRDPFGILDRKSTRLNSSHQIISYAVFCLKKKKNTSLPRPPHNYP